MCVAEKKKLAAAAGEHFVLLLMIALNERAWHHSAIVKTVSLWMVLQY